MGANLHLHQVSRVSVESEKIGNHTMQRVVIHYADHRGDPAEFRLTLYGRHSLQGVMDIPYTFSEVEEVEQ